MIHHDAEVWQMCWRMVKQGWYPCQQQIPPMVLINKRHGGLERETNPHLWNFVSKCKEGQHCHSLFLQLCLKELLGYKIFTHQQSEKLIDKIDKVVNTDARRCKIFRKVIEHLASMVNLWHTALSVLGVFLHHKLGKRICQVLDDHQHG